MKDFRRLKVWEKAHLLAVGVYRAPSRFPRQEMFGLASQMRRAAASIPSNLAEGCGRSMDGELGRFAEISMGSASELEYQLLLARDLGCIVGTEAKELSADVVEVKRMLSGLFSHVRQSRARTALAASG